MRVTTRPQNPPVARKTILLFSSLLVAGIAFRFTPADQARAASTSPLKTCAYSSLKSAVARGGIILFGCDGTIDFTVALSISKPTTLDASGQSVTLDGQSTSQIFLVKSASLTLIDLTLVNGKSTGAKGSKGSKGKAGEFGDNGKDGGDGTDGSDNGDAGTKGGNGTVGSDGDDGSDGGPGLKGQDAQGGAITVAAGATLTVSGGTIKDSFVAGGSGGSGGQGGHGGDGGYGGAGGDGGDGADGYAPKPGGAAVMGPTAEMEAKERPVETAQTAEMEAAARSTARVRC